MLEFLETTFSTFDGGLLRAMHSLAESAGSFFTPVFKGITFIGEKGIIFFAIACILMLFARTRKLGVCMFGAVACGAIMTNLVLKDIVARPRPFLTSSEYNEFWTFVGCPNEDGFSFPSGHITAISAAMMSMFILCNKKWSWVGFIAVLLMGVSRIYLVAHYPTDVIAGIVVGAISAVIAYFITKLIYHLLNKHKEKKFCRFVLSFSLIKPKKQDEVKDFNANK